MKEDKIKPSFITMTFQVEVEFFQNGKHDLETSMKIAQNLAMHSNYVTVEEGIHVKKIAKTEPKFFYQTNIQK